MKIPQHILEAIDCGEENAEKYYSIYGKKEIDQALAQLKQSDEEILAAYPAERVFAVAKTRRHFISQKYVGIVFAAAAALVLTFTTTLNVSGTKTPTAAAPATDSPNRLKGPSKTGNGEPQLFIYRKEGQGVNLLKNKTKAKQGDQLQLAFNSNGKPFVLIFSVDGRGNVTNHFPSNKLNSKLVDPNAGTAFLDFSYELDDAPLFETFVIISSDNPFDIEAKKAEIAGMSLKELAKGSFVPEQSQFSIFTLKK